jgi:hypothetical protein
MATIPVELARAMIRVLEPRQSSFLKATRVLQS